MIKQLKFGKKIKIKKKYIFIKNICKEVIKNIFSYYKNIFIIKIFFILK